MSHGNRRGRGRRPDNKKEPQPKPDVDESSPIIQQFLQFQKTLDRKHDKYERLVKLSRDVTIESKRTIFLLQRISGDEDKEHILPDAHKKLMDLQNVNWRPIAKELDGEDIYQYLRAISPGMQEYIEAISFYRFLERGDLIPIEEVTQTLIFSKTDPEKEKDPQGTAEQQHSPMKVDLKEVSQSSSVSTSHDQISVQVPPMEYMLGIADLTGEVMRMAIHSIGSGSLDKPLHMCTFLRTIYDAFLLFGNAHREMNRKMFTLKQSLQKVETACYTLQVRGSEIPKHMLIDVLSNVGSDHYEYREGLDIDPV